MDSLRLQIVVQALKTALTTVAGLLDAAEWSVRGWEIPVVDSDGAGFDLSGYAESAGNGVGVDASWDTCQ